MNGAVPASHVARQWFVPDDGIDRHVIVTNIQHYLGKDVTMRSGKGTGENEACSFVACNSVELC